MVKQIKYTYRGMNQDVTKSKHPFEFYYSANNIRILATDDQSTYSVTNEKGNELLIEFPNVTIDVVNNIIDYEIGQLPYHQGSEIPEIESQINSGILLDHSTIQKIIGYSITRDGILFFTTQKKRTKQMDCIWLIDNILNDSYSLKLIYVRNLNFSIENPIQALYNYENEKVQKVYWVDGRNQLRFINISHSIENNDLEELIDLNSNIINSVGNFNLSQPVISDIVGGGNHTAGKIQYAYNLYRLNSSQTKISPLSELLALSKGENLGGGEVNEVVGATPIIEINDLDTEYTHIKLYAIKYTSYNQIPSINLIADEEINSNGTFEYYDDGAIIESITLSEFLFLGSDPIVPKNIESKDNTLFSANIEEKSFDVNLDLRAYSFREFQEVTYLLDNVMLGGGSPVPDIYSEIVGEYLQVNENYNVPLKHDCVNPNYDSYKYQRDSNILGGEGKYLKYELTQMQNILDDNFTNENSKNEYFKDEEIYRIGIQLYNILGQKTQVEWISDIKAPSGNLLGLGNTLKVELKPEFYIWLNDSSNFTEPNSKPIGYKIVRADRKMTDRTILCQGSLTQMMVQTPVLSNSNGSYLEREVRVIQSDLETKVPITLSRGFVSNINPLIETDHLRFMHIAEAGPYNTGSGLGNSGASEFPNEEIFSFGGSQRQHSWQYTKMYQLNSPEILFEEGIKFSNDLRINIKGLCKNTKNDIWYKRIYTPNGGEVMTRKYSDVSSFMDNIDIRFMGLFGPADNVETQDQTLINREYKTFIPTVSKVDMFIYGKPELTERGQGITSYNGDSRLNYSNTMESFLTDGGSDSDERAIISMNSYGSRCLTIVPGPNDSGVLTDHRVSLETLHLLSNITEKDGILLAEIKIPEKNIYLGNIYGGNSYESKIRNTYLEIGNYKKINESVINIDSPGDTFVNYFKFARISKTDTEILDSQVLQLTEKMQYGIETTIDLKNRIDSSLFSWDSKFQPRYDEYHDYNRVYSQQSTLVQNISNNESFKKITNFDTRIMASKVKVPGERIDNWTDFLENEVMDLDGKYGPINGLVNLRDNIFALQDSGVSAISINPRVQVQGSDGLAIEIGSGGVLYDYTYLSTKSGSLNKWSIIPSNSGFYYFDALNKSWNRYNGSQIQGLSDSHGFHSFFNNNVDFSKIKLDNPILGNGIVSGYNPVTNDIYITVLQEGNSFTLCFNEMTNSFTSFYDYLPSLYIMKGFKMITPNPNNTQLWEHFKGEYGNFYNKSYDTKIKFLVNPNDKDCVFNNIEYKSELSLNGEDLPKETITHIKANNEYQSSVITPLELNFNLNRKFRMWRANIPRESINGNPSLNRIRGHWTYLELLLKNNSNYKMILHDVNVNYTAYN